jgi:hypothetical protein
MSFYHREKWNFGVEKSRVGVEMPQLFAEMAQDLAGQRRVRTPPAWKLVGKPP